MSNTPLNQELEVLRDIITNAYRMDESDCIERRLADASLPEENVAHIKARATELILESRQYRKKQSKIDALLHQYDLSTEEGIALMCMAEALLRIPDTATIDQFISDKLSNANWSDHWGAKHSFFINAATWSLLLTGKIYAPALDKHPKLMGTLKKAVSRIGIAMIRPVILKMMKAIGNQFVVGENIKSALKRAAPLETLGYRFSYDMLGEAARTRADAEHYYTLYTEAIIAIGKTATQLKIAENPGISVKLSALHPRYEYTQRERVLKELPPLVLKLALLAKQYNIGMTIDAEEADRLDLSLDVFQIVFSDSALNHWEGLGLAVQAYQKRAFYVLDWLAALSKQCNKRMMIRLVKGAYWDAEIKLSQIHGFEDYPVFTRKSATDVSYLACIKKILSYSQYFYSQFGTHNAYSIATVMELVQNNKEYEFQCLHGMGRLLYDQIMFSKNEPHPVRIYAPVGTHKDLLGYLVRRLLENGANSSFINRLADENFPIEKISRDPVAYLKNCAIKRHPRIPLPQYIYNAWDNASGWDLSNSRVREKILAELQNNNDVYSAAALINGNYLFELKTAHPVYSPSQHDKMLGQVCDTPLSDVEKALQHAYEIKTWENYSIEARASIFEKAADLLTTEMTTALNLLVKEGGKSILDSIAEIRETIDYCRYYAYSARNTLKPLILPSPTGELNELSLHARGIIICISPWNFPLAIFAGQIIAALVTGNTVIAKPAEQTPLIATFMVKLLHRAGVPKKVLQLVLGEGATVGTQLTKDARIAGVMFTGSTETAKIIEQTLAKRTGPLAVLIAETGGQNAMIVDSSALPEQTVIDIVNSAFNSAGQRCSALRVLFVQEEIAPQLLQMLTGYMAQLTIGDPQCLSTDIGPVIDQDALTMLKMHYKKMQQEAKLIMQMDAKNTEKGFYFAPCIFEIENINLLEKEIFGPILHVIRYKANALDKVIDAIIQTRYGLTLGIHSRIEATIQYIISRMPVGNMYVNRNMIGAVVGVQPFGGENLSGTGPKAGGPHYLPRLCVERVISINTTAIGGNARLVSLLEDD